MLVKNIDTTNMCSHLRHKLMDADGIYHQIWQTIQDDSELTAVVRSLLISAQAPYLSRSYSPTLNMAIQMVRQN